MSDPDDYDLQREYVEPPSAPVRSIGWWIAAAIATIAAAAGLYLTVGRQSAETPAAPAPVAAREPPARSLGGEPEPVALPPLDESDAVVRTLVGALSKHPVVSAWLASDDLVRKFTAAVSNIAEGTSPAKQLTALRPHAAFLVVEKDGKYFIDPRSYDRYASVAGAVDSIDPAGAAKLYATLKPRIADAAGELGLSADQFDRLLERAIVALLGARIPDGPIQITPSAEGVGYDFVDGRLEGLSAGQKALVRMGPRNMRIIKAKLREIAVALGVRPVQRPPD